MSHALPRGVVAEDVLKIGPVLRLEDWGEWCKRTLVLTADFAQCCSVFEGELVHRGRTPFAFADDASEATEEDLAAHTARTRPTEAYMLPEVEQENMFLLRAGGGMSDVLLAAADDKDRESWLEWLRVLLQRATAERTLGAMRRAARRHDADLLAEERRAHEAAGEQPGPDNGVTSEERAHAAELDKMERAAHEAEEAAAKRHERGAVERALARAQKGFDAQLRNAGKAGDEAVARERRARVEAEEVAVRLEAELAKAALQLADASSAGADTAAQLALAQEEAAKVGGLEVEVARLEKRQAELESELLTNHEEAFNLIQQIEEEHGEALAREIQRRASSRPQSAASHASSRAEAKQ